MLDGALGAVRLARPYGSPEDAADDLVRLALAYLEFAAKHTVRWRALFEHRMSEARPLPQWFVDQQHALFAQIERQALLRVSRGFNRIERAARCPGT